MGSGVAEAGAVRYEVEGQPFEGYYLAADVAAPWWCWCTTGTGSTAMKSSAPRMLVALGYSVLRWTCSAQGEADRHGVRRSETDRGPYRDRSRMRKLLQRGLAEAGRQGRLDKCGGPRLLLRRAAMLSWSCRRADLKGW